MGMTGRRGKGGNGTCGVGSYRVGNTASHGRAGVYGELWEMKDLNDPYLLILLNGTGGLSSSTTAAS